MRQCELEQTGRTRESFLYACVITFPSLPFSAVPVGSSGSANDDAILKKMALTTCVIDLLDAEMRHEGMDARSATHLSGRADIVPLLYGRDVYFGSEDGVQAESLIRFAIYRMRETFCTGTVCHASLATDPRPVRSLHPLLNVFGISARGNGMVGSLSLRHFARRRHALNELNGRN